MHTIPKLLIPIFSICLLSLTTSGCDRSETQAETRADVAKAQSEGAKEVAEERREAAESRTDEQKDVNQASAALARETAEGNREVALAEANAAHKVGIEKCEAMTADMRSACKKQADADLDRAKAQAKM